MDWGGGGGSLVLAREHATEAEAAAVCPVRGSHTVNKVPSRRVYNSHPGYGMGFQMTRRKLGATLTSSHTGSKPRGALTSGSPEPWPKPSSAPAEAHPQKRRAGWRRQPHEQAAWSCAVFCSCFWSCAAQPVRLILLHILSTTGQGSKPVYWVMLQRAAGPALQSPASQHRPPSTCLNHSKHTHKAE